MDKNENFAFIKLYFCKNFVRCGFLSGLQGVKNEFVYCVNTGAFLSSNVT